MKYSIFTTPRSGSKLLLCIIWPYLREKFGYMENLKEISNPTFVYYDTGNSIALSYHEDRQFVEEIDKEILYKYKLLKKYHDQDFFIKFFPHDNDDEWQYILDNYNLILLERKNKREQFLSFIISSETDIWTIYDNVKYPPKATWATFDKVVYPPKVLFKEQHKQFLERSHKEYQNKKNVIMERNNLTQCVIYYEDMISLDNPFEILEQCEFLDWRDYIKDDTYTLPKKMNPSNKEKYIENIDEFDEWFDKFMSSTIL